ncbi:dihydrolipoyllysine-residue acetyltransferase [Neisseria meningitidis]|uniref:Acetyltransferase component of pyruvate dehydrogenase complex n=1 Tax=Neisseria meningitidis serogroup B (strain ATCC 13091 / M2091) TaxID=862513 RepID=E0N8E3_NEIM3|nr:dihydrolipoyllysine-residue acetyltransferase [Neisseria meningitidis]EFM04715.1 dihydrolipoyllysine-residue acetyltransferase [Neisseria meningitidis ATCC 13091]MBW3863174.1 dihydrolipoyllysine-residue acetyltransferase [Neisseria meningitidis]MBW3869167.1 dihydrolipoyllysine-residue acetyltransferase [Neisseria meningitidis]MBW3877206.1 dihydrolipoyllysine-residue acetyltransferase [Neisseria meningitidis]MBW3885609.1 dihydrolipoyllysine-residue acetyltransferase [Neisseria meningitidis]
MSIVEIKVPDIGGHENVDIIAVEVKAGDTIAVDDTLITLETDKATMDVPADAAGVVKEVKVKVGDKISEGGVILTVETGAAAAEAAPAAAEAQPAPAAAPVAAGGATVQVAVPDIGGHTDVDVIAVEIKVGDTVAEDDTLITLETDKATMDVPCTAAGVVKAVFLKVGDKVSEGSAIIEVETVGSAAAAPAQAAQAAAPAAAAPAAAPAAAKIDEAAFAKAHAGPSARKLARELGVDLGQVKGTGLKGRIVGDDIKAFVKSVMQGGAAKPAAAGASLGSGLDLLPWPKVDFSKFGNVEVKELSRIKKISGQNLSRNWVVIPHVTVHEEADMTELEEFRKQLNKEWEREGVKLSPLAFIIKASVSALKAFPEFNASLDGDNLVLKNYFNIGFAADTPNGLVVPVIKDVDQKGLKQISQELTELSKKAREGKLKPQEMQGACFTISSLGGIGGTGFTPIVNAPEVAILGVCKSQIKPIWNGKEFAPRLMCPLSLSFDHRVIDGAAGMRFTVFLAKLLKDFRRITL